MGQPSPFNSPPGGGAGGSPYNPASVAISGGTINGTVIGGTTPAAGAFTGLTTTAASLFNPGTAALPGVAIGETDTGFSRQNAGTITGSADGSAVWALSNLEERVGSGMAIGWSSNASVDLAIADTKLTRLSAGAVALQGATTANTASLRRYGGNAGYVEWGSVAELLVLSTGGLTTDTTANLLPADSIIEAVTARVTTTIATATTWAVGDPTTPTRFSAANATLVAGTTSVGTTQVDQTGAPGPRQVAAAKVRITTVGIPSAGAIRLTSYYRTFVAPTS